MTRYGRLEALRSVSRQADDEDQAAAAARTAAAALTAQIDAASRDLDARRRHRPELGRERDQAAEAAQRGPAIRAEADRYRRAADDASALVKALADKSRQERAWITAKLDAAELIMKAARLREARIDGMRAELAATLVDGAPCPVCGSLDHPELCELQGERVTREQEEAADAEAAAATEQAELTGARLGAADVRVNHLSARLARPGSPTPATCLLPRRRHPARQRATWRPRPGSWPPPRPASATCRPRSTRSTGPSRTPRSGSSN